jgi:Raf kinase inhibitor-like YbhB/YbcL family protein
MPPTTSEIRENSTSPGVVGKNTGGNLVYFGPCPPDREHRYFFKLYALDILLKLAPGATKEQVLAAMEGHILAQTELMGRYERAKSPS